MPVPEKIIAETLNRWVLKMNHLRYVLDKEDFKKLIDRFFEALDNFRGEDADSTK
jgi:hypothetical protein